MLFPLEPVARVGERKCRWRSSAPDRVVAVGCKMDCTSQTVRVKMLICLIPSSMAQSGVVPLDLEELSELQLAATSGLHLE